MKDNSTRDRPTRDNKVLAYILIGLGALFLLSRIDVDTGWLWVGIVAAAFLYGYVRNKSYGLLVAGSVLTGVAVGLLLEEGWGWNGAFLVSLGVGFLVIDRVEPRQSRWPLYIAGLLVILGLVTGLSEAGMLGSFWLAVVLIGGGVYLLNRDRKKEVDAGTSGSGGSSPPSSKNTPSGDTHVAQSPQPTETVAPSQAKTETARTEPRVEPKTQVVSQPNTARDATPPLERDPLDPPPVTETPPADATPPVTSAQPETVTNEQVSANTPDPALLERLERWRRETSKREDRAAYLILTNASLQQIAAEKPQTLNEVKAIKGIGPVKLERYGEAILELTRST